MSKIKNGLDQYCAKPSKQQQFGTAGVEGVKRYKIFAQLAVTVGGSVGWLLGMVILIHILLYNQWR